MKLAFITEDVRVDKQAQQTHYCIKYGEKAPQQALQKPVDNLS